MPFSNETRRHASTARSIRVLFGEAAYREYQRTKVAPPGLIEARKALHAGKSIAHARRLALGGSVPRLTKGRKRRGLPKIRGRRGTSSIRAARTSWPSLHTNGKLDRDALYQSFPPHGEFSPTEAKQLADLAYKAAKASDNPDLVFKQINRAYTRGFELLMLQIRQMLVPKVRGRMSSAVSPVSTRYLKRILRMLGLKAKTPLA